MKPTTLRRINCAGAAVTPDIVRICTQVIGAKSMGSSFGMSEGTPLWVFAETAESIIVSDNVKAGVIVDGGKIRICAPESTEPLPRGEAGELQ